MLDMTLCGGGYGMWVMGMQKITYWGVCNRKLKNSGSGFIAVKYSHVCNQIFKKRWLLLGQMFGDVNKVLALPLSSLLSLTVFTLSLAFCLMVAGWLPQLQTSCLLQ